MKPLEISGTIGEGGGQLVRTAIALSALTGQAVTISDIRGGRERGGKCCADRRVWMSCLPLTGLKSQHATAIQFLAEATDADVEGLTVGSRTVTFCPRRGPADLLRRNISISAESGSASTLLILQAILPFLVFAGNESDEPVELEISGGTNVSFSLSFEYLDQVLLPTLEDRFSIRVERRLIRRGWSLGPQSRGKIWIKLFPLKVGQSLLFKAPSRPQSYEVKSIDVSMVVPISVQEKLQASLTKDLADLFPGSDVHFKLVEDSSLDSRWYILLVAHSGSGIRWGHDFLGSMPKKTKNRDNFSAQISSKVCRGLYGETSAGGQADVHLQDQVVVFQALCDGYSSLPRNDVSSPDILIDAMGNLDIGNGRMRKERTHEPFGHGSLHARTARWLVSELLPSVEFYNKGDLVKGSGTKV
jgi:RNA 3'-terminal phosphate cyclase (ATP)